MGKIKTTVVPQIRAVYYTTYANFPTSGVQLGDLGFATDRKVLYEWDGSAWQPITIYSGSGLAADIPDPSLLPDGSLYYETDTTLLKQVQSSIWVTIKPVLPGLKLKAETRDMTAASGDVAYTGYGFTPVGIFVLGATTTPCIGASQPDETVKCLGRNDTGLVTLYSNLIFLGTSTANQAAIVKSYDVDGFTLTWTKTGSPTGTATLIVLAVGG